MSVNIRPTTTGGASTASPLSTRPVTGVVAGSLAAGALMALVLALVVFPGATEAVITGSMLLAFGFGWALMAVLTTRVTSRAQSWAAVPAVFMGTAGLALLTLSPGDAVLTAVGWIWPPAMVALVVWTFLQVRRHLRGAGRWMVTLVLVVLAAVSIGATTENVTLARDHGAYPAPGQTYEVAGHRLHLDCRGQGGPTVVLFNGLGEFSGSWARITDEVGATTRVCAYDRPGQGWSEEAGSPQDGVTAAQDLHLLLAAAGEDGPYVLVGHSTGGTYALNYAARYPAQVAGMVLLDSSSPEQFTVVTKYAGQYPLMRRGLALFPTVARLGVNRALATSGLPGDAGQVAQVMTTTPRAFRNGRDEVTMIPEVFEQAQALTTLQDRPLVVLTASENLTNPGWIAAQDKLATLSTDHLHRTVDATHEGLVEDEPGATQSVLAITQVLSAVRTGSLLAAP
jgi:pimeloyl-ACP methyl ester carboxylesterase